MDNKLSELSKPAAWVLHARGGDVPTLDECYVANAEGMENIRSSPLYSQEYVSALLAELEAKDKRIAELSVGKVGNALLERENHHVEVVDKMLERIAELEAYNTKLRDWNAGLAQESCELQTKLATPVRLPTASRGKFNAWLTRLAIKNAGFTFTVEGDEQ